MVKCKSKFLFIFFLLSFLFMSSNAKALGFLGLLPSFVHDPGAMATQFINNVNAEINKYGSIVMGEVKKTLNGIKSLVDQFKNLLGKKEDKVPGTKEIEKSKIVDIYDENSIKPAFQELFFEYPSDQPRIQLAYKDKGREFYEDTLIEAFTAVRELEKSSNKLNQKIIDITNETRKSDNRNQGLYNLYRINQGIDEVATILQELIAIKAQMAAASAVLNRVEPLYNGTPTKGIVIE